MAMLVRKPMTATIRIVLADDNPLFRQAFRSLLEKRSHLEVVAEADSGQSAIEKAAEHRPDLVFMDISMPLINGIDATKEITSRFPGIKVIVLSVYEVNEGFSEKAYEAGAFHYLTKTSSREEIFSAIDRVSNLDL
jgi:DNA-binding NarL/FixJ family response regulator